MAVELLTTCCMAVSSLLKKDNENAGNAMLKTLRNGVKDSLDVESWCFFWSCRLAGSLLVEEAWCCNFCWLPERSELTSHYCDLPRRKIRRACVDGTKQLQPKTLQ